MRRFSTVALLSSTLAVAPAFAQEGGFYAGADLGAVISAETDQDYVPGSTVGSTGNISTDHEIGLTGSAFVGYRFGAIRVEAEAGYLSADIDGLTSNFILPGGVTGSQSSIGEVSAQTFMANATVDVGQFSDFTFFVGGGAGVAKLKVSEMTSSTGTIVLDDESDWKSAWQASIGVRKPLATNIDLQVRYRYFDVDDAEMTGFGGRTVTAGLTAHSIVGGVTFNF